MNSKQHRNLREFAVFVVQRLRDAGYQALWAGGCVRDQLLGIPPKDYDVATNATPQQVQVLFGDRRTLGIGAAFGVVAVLGPRPLRVEVATFRQDASYSDGRHPDAVVYSNAEQDAQRRDFTINGLFFDPLSEQVIDFVGGADDLQRRIVRAIGNPYARFDEDKLRMLRAVRFTAVYDFQLDHATLSAIQSLSRELVIVSAERIAEEMRKMLSHPRRARAVELLRQSRLLEVILPESKAFDDEEAFVSPEGTTNAWSRTLGILDSLSAPTFPVALAALLHELGETANHADSLPEHVGRRWKLSNHEIECVAWVRRHERIVRSARQTPWPQLQRILVSRYVDELLTLAESVARTVDGSLEDIAFCRQKLALPRSTLDPAPLLRGDDLIRAGVPRGPVFRILLERARDAQLNGEITTPAEALHLALQWATDIPPTTRIDT